MALCIFLAVISIEARTSSLTALELAPGALNTGIAFSVYLSIGILLTPEPALPTAFNAFGISISCISNERRIIASGFVTSSPQ